MTFAALGDLLDPVVDEVLDEIPSMQRSALRTALLRAEPGDYGLRSALRLPRHAGVPSRLGSRSSGSACHRRCSMARSILRDRPSLRRAATAGRADRCLHPCEPTGRGRSTGSGGAMREGASHLVLVRSMSPDDIGRPDQRPSGRDLSRPVRERVHDAANGNPFFALEIARELTRSGPPDVGETLPLPRTSATSWSTGYRHCPSPRQILLTTAAAARPTVALLAPTSGVGPDTEEH
jgi:hypothetical protein